MSNDLEAQRERLRRELQAVEDLIAQQPETIAAAFAHVEGLDAAILNVTFIQPAEGWTDSRKNAMPWSGYRFRLAGDQTTYLYRNGENWCSSISDCGPEGQEAEDVSCPEEFEEEDEAPPAEVVEKLRKDYAPHMIVAMLLKLRDA